MTRGAVLSVLLVAASWAGAAAAQPAPIPPPLIPGAIHCDVEPADGFQRNCRVNDGSAPSHDQRLEIIAAEGRLTLWQTEKPETADAPFAFRGWWIEPGKPCNPWADDSQVRIGVNLATFYAGEGRIQDVKVIGPDEIEMTLDIMTDPGDLTVLHLKLSPDHERLTEINVDNSFERVRCDGWP